MSDLFIEIPTERKSMAELRAHLDAALGQQFPGGMLQRHWEGDVLHLHGPGAKGTITLEEGKLVGRAALGPPATLMRAIIEQKVETAMKVAAS
ncbi:MAG TPA: polyhydroxyalkanoic acid system family protein [Thermoanaerobaculia bacterium]|nr:polyhydroxyalkanoic acid system family protein [Thermoanaerobaculia bacterium]